MIDKYTPARVGLGLVRIDNVKLLLSAILSLIIFCRFVFKSEYK
jgi:hypothetical protein